MLLKSFFHVSDFDHFLFPGVVPRTFAGPLILSLISCIPKYIFRLSPFLTLHLVRFVLAALCVSSLLSIRNALASRFTSLTATLFSLFTASQFHVLFYSSRTLPNTFALVLTNFAFANRLRSHPNNPPYPAIALLSIACALFRSELSLYIFTTLLTDIASFKLKFSAACRVAIFTAVITALSSIALDSYFWQRLCYPELEVFFFNVLLNKSSAWGTHPFHWYFTNALPRALGGVYLLAFIALISQFSPLAPLLLPVLFFISLYSILPHKELRFIIYALPVFNAVAAISVEGAVRHITVRLHTRVAKKRSSTSSKQLHNTTVMSFRFLRNFLLSAFAVLTIAISALQTVISSAASQANYPSGISMRKLHSMENQLYSNSGLCQGSIPPNASVHIDVDSAMNGISQYVQVDLDPNQLCPKWSYSKREDVEQLDWTTFSHLISERKAVPGFCVIHVESIFAGFDWQNRKIRRSPHTFVHRNVNISKFGCR